MEIPPHLRGQAPNDYLATNPEHQRFVQEAAVTILNEDPSLGNIDAVVDNAPEAIATRNPAHFGQFDEISPEDLKAILQDA